MAGKRTVELEFVIDDKQATQRLKNIEQSTGKTASAFSKAGTLIKTGFVAVLGSQVLSAVGSTISAASDLEESINAVKVTFGSSAQKILDWAETAAASAGLSNSAANQLIVPIGAMLQNVGISADEAAEKSILLAQRAADMASVFNVDVSEALGAIQAGLRGEADPLERFGVGLSAAAVEAKILESGIRDSKNEITAADKVLGRYMLLMEQSERVAGDFANTSGSLANRQRVLAAEFENTKAKFGDLLTGPAAEATGAFQDVVDIADVLVGKLGELKNATEEAGAETDSMVELWQLTTPVGGLLLELLHKLGAAARDDAASGIREYHDALDEGRHRRRQFIDDTDEATASLEEQRKEIKRQTDPFFAYHEAVEKQAEAQRDYASAVLEFGPASKQAEDAGLDLLKAQGDLAFAQQDLIDLGPAGEEMLRRWAEAAGISAEELNRMLDAILAIRDNPLPGMFTPVRRGEPPQIMHHGGVVPGAPGSDVPIIAQAGETIIPAGHRGEGGTVNIYVSALDPKAAAKAVAEAVQRARRMGYAI